MTITRDGKIYALTASERAMAFEEELRERLWSGISCAVDDNSENLLFSDSYTEDEFIDDCVDEAWERFERDRGDFMDYDDIVFDMAESNDIWRDEE